MITFRKLCLTAAALALSLGAGTFAASAAPFNTAAPGQDVGNGNLIQVGWKHKRKYRKHKRHHRRHYHRRGRYVEAPYTDVDTYYGDVDVDAPYARVHRSRRGVHVRAPFVDIYIPR